MIDTQSLQVVKKVFSSSLTLWAVIDFRLFFLGQGCHTSTEKHCADIQLHFLKPGTDISYAPLMFLLGYHKVDFWDIVCYIDIYKYIVSALLWWIRSTVKNFGIKFKINKKYYLIKYLFIYLTMY